MNCLALRVRAVPGLWSLVLALVVGAGLMAAPPSASAAPASKRPITHEDVWLMKRPGALAVSPDGRWVVVSVTEPSYEENGARSDLWIVPADGSAPARRLTSGRGSEVDVTFSDDGSRIAFLAKRDDDDHAQVYVLPLAGGEAQRVTNWPGGAKAPRFSPDGASILFVGPTAPGAVTEDDNRKAAAARKARKYNARAYDAFPIRHWDRWLDELRPSLLVQPLDGVSPARDLLAGSELRKGAGYGGRLGNDGDVIDATWTRDGRGVVFAATTNRNDAARAEVRLSLWHVKLDGGEPRRLTGEEGDYSSPEFTAGRQDAGRQGGAGVGAVDLRDGAAGAVVVAVVRGAAGAHRVVRRGRRPVRAVARQSARVLHRAARGARPAVRGAARRGRGCGDRQADRGHVRTLCRRRHGGRALGGGDLVERVAAARNRARGPVVRKVAGAHEFQCGACGGDRHAAGGGVLVHVEPRQADPQLRVKPPAFDAKKKISAVRA